MPRPVNLIADKLSYRDEIRKRAIRATACLVICAFVGLAVISAIKVASARMSDNLRQVQAETKLLKEKRSLLEQMKSRTSEDLAVSEWASAIRSTNQASHEALSELSASAPNDMFFNQISLDMVDNQVLEVSGAALSLADVAAFIRNLSRPAQFGSVMLESAEAGEFNDFPVVNFRCSAMLTPRDMR